MGLEKPGVTKLLKEGLTAKGVLVGHLDTGVDATHPALKNAIALFTAIDEYGIVMEPSPVPFDSDDPNGHGTHTAATIAGRPVGGRRVGVAPGAELARAIVIEGGITVARLLGGLEWAIQQQVRIINISLGFYSYTEDLLPIVQILRRNNVLPVCAIGNEGPGTSRSPGNYGEALSVGAVDKRLKVWKDSSSQSFRQKLDPVPDLVGPGVEVVSARRGGGYQMMSGTSMAAPHIAGLAALLMEARNDASTTRVERAILDSCRHERDMPQDRAGLGFPNAQRALALLA